MRERERVREQEREKAHQHITAISWQNPAPKQF